MQYNDYYEVYVWLPLKVDGVDSSCKSNFWVTQLAVSYIETKSPGLIRGIAQYLSELSENDVVILVDDASYSGLQAKALLDDNSDEILSV